MQWDTPYLPIVKMANSKKKREFFKKKNDNKIFIGCRNLNNYSQFKRRMNKYPGREGIFMQFRNRRLLKRSVCIRTDFGPWPNGIVILNNDSKFFICCRPLGGVGLVYFARICGWACTKVLKLKNVKIFGTAEKKTILRFTKFMVWSRRKDNNLVKFVD